MNQLSKVFIIVGSVLILLLLMVWLPPVEIGSVHLRPVRILSDLLPTRDTLQDVLPAPPAVKPAEEKTAGKYQPYRPKGVVMIDDYAQNAPGGMNHFYSMLSRVDSLRRPIRIAYYSDSFIEGDVLTADLRENLQQQYGGCGIGWIDCENGTNGARPTIKLNSNGFNGHVTGQPGFQPSLQGINQKYFRPGSGASLSLNATGFRKGTSQWTSAKVFFKSASAVSLSLNNVSKTFSGSSSVQTMESLGNVNTLSLKVNSGGAVFFGMALEGQKGIIVDNLGVRGIPGFSINHIPDNTLADFARLRPYDLIIIHYGLNVSSDESSNAYFESYKQKMKQVVKKLRKAYPEASILIVGVSDRDQRYADGIHTMHSIHRLEGYQNLIASECGVAFYSMFRAMGGEDTMKGFVDKGWANKDYTHINFKGGKYIADRMCKSLNAGLEDYKRKKAARLIK